MLKKDRLQLNFLFEKICRKDKYLGYFKGARIVSYNDYKNDELILLIYTIVNGKEYLEKRKFNDNCYHDFDEEKLIEIYTECQLKNLRKAMRELL